MALDVRRTLKSATYGRITSSGGTVACASERVRHEACEGSAPLSREDLTMRYERTSVAMMVGR